MQAARSEYTQTPPDGAGADGLPASQNVVDAGPFDQRIVASGEEGNASCR